MSMKLGPWISRVDLPVEGFVAAQETRAREVTRRVHLDERPLLDRQLADQALEL